MTTVQLSGAKRQVETTHNRKPSPHPESTSRAPESIESQATVENPLTASPGEILSLQQAYGNRAVQRLIQLKLAVGPVGDQYEQEADRVAQQVMTMPVAAPAEAQPAVQRAAPEEEEKEAQLKPLSASITPMMQREAAPEEDKEEEELRTKPLLQREEEKEEEELRTKPLLQREEEKEEEELRAKPLLQRSGGGFQASADLEQRLDASRGNGSPLPADVRSFMEPRFGTDFSSVRLHTGSDAVQMNREVSAQAFTLGQDIYLGAGKYNPGSAEGKQLLAHELTHVVQQGGVQRHSQPEDLTTTASPSVQRHPAGTELPDKNAQVIEIGEKEKKTPEKQATASNQAAPEKLGENATLAPEATRTKQVETAEKKAGKEAGTAFTQTQKLTPGAMSLASAEKILQGAYGGLKKIVPGTIVILADQPACSAKYDEVCMADGVLHNGAPWQAGDCAKDDAAAGVQTEGFAWKGVVYVNGATTLVTATAHEILHNNAVPAFRSTVGETFNEGVTETLARKALTDAGVKVPSVTPAYPAQVALAKLLIDLVGIDVVEKAYFENVQELVRRYNRKGSSTWSKLVEAAEALDTEKVKSALKPGFGT